MKAIIQRVNNASVKVKEEHISEIGRGLVIFLGVEKGDSLREAEFLAGKIINLRCFEDKKGKMNFSTKNLNTELLVVSEVTLCIDLLNGRRPGFEKAAPAREAEKLYQDFISFLTDRGIRVKQGRFKQHMVVDISNDGPVTFILDSQQR